MVVAIRNGAAPVDLLYADTANLATIRRDMLSTLAGLKARTLAQLGDLETLPHKTVVLQEVAKDFDDAVADLVSQTVGYVEGRLPSEDEYRGNLKLAQMERA